MNKILEERKIYFWHFWYFTDNSESIVNIFCLLKYQYKMTYFKSVHVKLANLWLKKLKSAIKNVTSVTLINLSSNMIDDSSERTNFPYELLLIERNASRLCKAFVNS